jgi:hypothetical protein
LPLPSSRTRRSNECLRLLRWSLLARGAPTGRFGVNCLRSKKVAFSVSCFSLHFSSRSIYRTEYMIHTCNCAYHIHGTIKSPIYSIKKLLNSEYHPKFIKSSPKTELFQYSLITALIRSSLIRKLFKCSIDTKLIESLITALVYYKVNQKFTQYKLKKIKSSMQF